jgi:hypothetical protein
MNKIFSYIWLTIKNLIVAFIVWHLYASVSSKFEIIVLSMLFLIFSSLIFDHYWFNYLFLDLVRKLDSQFTHVLNALKDPLPQTEESQRALAEAQSAYYEARSRNYFNGFFALVIDVFVIWKLLSTVF